jgi:predicted RNA-binding Zn-ribbon protein involved in translation (DUF1610 family)
MHLPTEHAPRGSRVTHRPGYRSSSQFAHLTDTLTGTPGAPIVLGRAPVFRCRAVYSAEMADLFTSLSQALTLATRLRSMSERQQDGEFKRILDALLVELVDVQLKLEELMSENVALKSEVQAHANPQGELCPRCGELGWRVSSSRPHKTPGVISQTYSCPKCKLKEEVLIRPK